MTQHKTWQLNALVLEKTISEEVRLEFSFEYEENIQSFRIYKKINK